MGDWGTTEKEYINIWTFCSDVCRCTFRNHWAIAPFAEYPILDALVEQKVANGFTDIIVYTAAQQTPSVSIHL
jgi:hypothetical protein